MSRDIYQILESLDAAQKSVKQLPALFKPKDTSPQLAGPYPGQNATLGYLVGEGDAPQVNRGGYNKLRDREDYLDKRDLLYRLMIQAGTDPETKAEVKERLAALNQAAKQQGIIKEGEDVNPMAQAVTRRIVNQHPEWIVKYGVEALMQAIDDVTEGEDFEEIGTSDVSAYVQYVKRQLDDRMGSREEMDDRKPFAEETQDKEKHNQLAAELNAARKAGDMAKAKEIGDELMKLGGGSFEIDIHGQAKPMAESTTTEDVVSAVKKKLGDYLSDLSKDIKSDPDLKDKIPQDLDKIKSVKTITTDDGKEIKIRGNEDDGFRISIRNTDIKTPFKSLEEAVMACEMYCSRRKSQLETADYVEEKRS